MVDDFSRISSSLYEGDYLVVPELVQKCLDQGLTPDQILQQGLIAGMDKVGQDFKAGILFVPEVLIAARAMHAGMDILRPLLAKGGVKTVGKCVIGSVKGDLHDIGKNLVKMMLEGAGFEMIDLGTDVEPRAFVEAVHQHQPKLVGMSALLTTTMQNMKTTIDALVEAGVRDKVKVMVGGAPVTEAFAKESGADGYASNAASAVDIARTLAA
ncbi:MAG: corrinoid protein [Anaerolineales bacterium]|jgi:5-methyltetrahydrofolate--homocysteine methyltransferase